MNVNFQFRFSREALVSIGFLVTGGTLGKYFNDLLYGRDASWLLPAFAGASAAIAILDTRVETGRKAALSIIATSAGGFGWLLIDRVVCGQALTLGTGLALVAFALTAMFTLGHFKLSAPEDGGKNP